jgi:dethiobiotin synthetase
VRKLPPKIFIAGIGTGVGKTVASAVITEALRADYWKPVQCGNLKNSDSMVVKSLLSNITSKIHPETYRFKTASSPHFAAKAEGAAIKLSAFKTPVSSNRMIVEAAGGLMVPLNDKELVIDLIIKLKLPVVLVARNYLGSINHTILSINALNECGVNLLGIIYSGKNYRDNEEIVYKLTGVKTLGHISEAKTLNKTFIKQEASKLLQMLNKHFEITTLAGL